MSSSKKMWTSEKDFQLSVRKAARELMWKDYATWRPVKSPAGFPDLVLISQRLKLVTFAELKMDGNQPSPAQADFLDWLSRAGQSAAVWYPRHWEEILEWLATGKDLPGRWKL